MEYQQVLLKRSFNYKVCFLFKTCKKRMYKKTSIKLLNLHKSCLSNMCQHKNSKPSLISDYEKTLC